MRICRLRRLPKFALFLETKMPRRSIIDWFKADQDKVSAPGVTVDPDLLALVGILVPKHPSLKMKV